MILDALIRAAHILGNIAWLGGSVAAAVVVLVGDEKSRPAIAAAARKALNYVVVPGLLLAWVAGLSMLLPSFMESYAHAGWMHGKLTLGVIAAALHGVLSAKLRKDPNATGAVKGIAIALVVIATLAVVLVEWRPGS